MQFIEEIEKLERDSSVRLPECLLLNMKLKLEDTETLKCLHKMSNLLVDYDKAMGAMRRMDDEKLAKKVYMKEKCKNDFKIA